MQVEDGLAGGLPYGYAYVVAVGPSWQKGQAGWVLLVWWGMGKWLCAFGSAVKRDDGSSSVLQS